MQKEKLEQFYNKNYKKLMVIPIVLFIISLTFLFVKYSNSGEFIEKDVSLSGGITATLTTEREIDETQLEEFLVGKLGTDINARELSEFGTGQQLGIIVEVGRKEELSLEEQNNELKNELGNFIGVEIQEEDYSSDEVGSNLGQSFGRQLLIAVASAFIFMSIVVFITFRTFAPSIAVITAALMDMIIALAVISAMDTRLTGAGIAAFLLVIGYSVDTDILLTTKVLKRGGEGNLFERMFAAMKTGLTMSVTTLVALTVGLFVTNSFIIKQMFLIIIISLLIDIMATYLTNTGILKMYCDKKGIV